MLIVVTVAVLLAAGLLAYAFFEEVDARRSVEVLRSRVGQYGVATAASDPLGASAVPSSLAERLGSPVVRGLRRFAHQLAPSGYLERVRRQLTLAGHSQPADVDRFLVVRLLTVVAIPVLWLVVALDTSFHGVSLVALFVLIGLALVLGPESWLQQSVVARQSAIRRRLPDILDLLTISVEAGLGFEQALARTVASVPGPLSDEFARALGELRAGASRVEAFMAVVARTEVPELRTFILALIQAEEFGISVGSILRAQADEMRVRRRQYAEERAHKAPVKMLVPMAFCILPAMFVVVIGPAAISIIHALSHVGAA